MCAVELGPALASHLRARFRRQRHLEVVNARFEDAPLEEGAWDLVVSATAYHLVTGEARMTKPRALLAPGGVFAVIDTIQVRSVLDRGYFERSQPIYARYWPDEGAYRPAPEPDADPPVLEEMRASGLFAGVEVRRWRWDQVYGTDAYMDLVRSYSNTYDLDEERRARFLAELRAFVEAEPGGSVVRPLVITLVTGRRAEGVDEREP